MEGDFPSGAMVLVEYNRIKNFLDDARKRSKSKHLKDMIGVMLHQLQLYIDKALECKALVLATILHPRYRLAFIQKAYPEHKDQASVWINQEFSSALEVARQNSDETPTANSNGHLPEEDDDDFNEFTASANINPSQSAREAELDSYLMGQREFDKNKTCLDWWKVSLIFIKLACYQQVS